MAIYDSPIPAGPASGLIVRKSAALVPKEDAKIRKGKKIKIAVSKSGIIENSVVL
jgi:hypothetical protein